MDILFILGIVLTNKIFKWLAWPVYRWNSLKKKIIAPQATDPLLFVNATSLAENIRKRSITSEEIVKHYVKRIRQVNPLLNAVVEDRFEDALEDAKRIDKYISETNLTEAELERSKPLLGIPITVKGSWAVKGLSHSVGCLKRLNVKAESDCVAVQQLREAGAIPLLVSNTPEMCFSWDTTNFVTGTTCNPYNINYSSGGSSGGEGALLGTGASIAGIGSDAAGSLRVPAMFNGVFAHKASPGLVPLEGHCPFSSDENCKKFCTAGPITRYAEDLKLMMKALCGKMSKELKLDEKVDVSSLTIYYMDEIVGYPLMMPVQKEIKDAIASAVKHLGTVCNCNISNFKFQGLDKSFEISISQFLTLKDMPYILKDTADPKKEDNLYIELLKCLFGASNYTRDALLFYLIQRIGSILETKERNNKYLDACNRLREDFVNKLNTTGVFIYPTFPMSAYLHGEILTEIVGITYPMIFNILGLPATQIPLSFDKNGLPVGFQVVAAPNQDRLGLAIAVELEKHFGGWIPPT